MSKTKKMVQSLANLRQEEQDLGDDLLHEIHTIRDRVREGSVSMRKSFEESKLLEITLNDEVKELGKTKQAIEDAVEVKKQARRLTKKGVYF